jgi:2-oxoglutarate ferredoxin oxidoreductase subunit delta
MAESKSKKARGTVIIVAERCKGCGFCVECCPAKCLEFSKQYNAKGYHQPVLARTEDCTGCDMCGMVCPDFAIYGFSYKKNVKGQ